ncbi:4-carboxymuconolactone decarboxylase [Chitinimonas koreensis]|uniref:4-carboxymuconolactone decarboxylase n=1 Tax=Chitinimonas koreensis TaxID=356302 RepID=UPI000416EF39|nr:4-carboxymuconolactone decarboxylase [Chitinimonas koreensis]QNM94703.1 4-carboxymuconolactone decarboxylase [Chitinimonas koreensis]
MSEQFERGLKVRREVMGDAFVDKAFAEADDFTRPLQHFITEQAWGTVWNRDGLDRKTRSLITLAMLAALGRAQELKGHVRGALNNGASVDEIREVLMHSAVYAGVPMCVDAFRAAREVIAAAGAADAAAASATNDEPPR